LRRWGNVWQIKMWFMWGLFWWNCLYVSLWPRQGCSRMTALIEDREAEILKECITCVACKRILHQKGLILLTWSVGFRKEQLPSCLPEKLISWFGPACHLCPVEMVRGDLWETSSFLSVYWNRGSHREQSKVRCFDGLTIVKGENIFVIFLRSYWQGKSDQTKCPEVCG